MFVDEYVEFYLNVHPVDMPADLRRRLLAFTTVVLDIKGTRTHRLNQLTLQPTNFDSWTPNSWVEFIVSFDMFFSVIQSVLYRKLRILLTPIVINVSPDTRRLINKQDFSCQVHDWRLDWSIPIEISWQRVQDVSHLFEPRGNMLIGLRHPTRLETIIYECVVSTKGKEARAHTRLLVGKSQQTSNW
ncbi:hypothetical protein PHET_11772 [Paragonimus heterotremus]|uniref:Uncharacterized protein n=1 Tax=Paragonimus heterotremus TaxID=100268 RepID=A0A8J4T0I9_9TREM|nr:hypothetical protein PHET_11772 [Paragonimus heterotremus]